MRLCHGTFFDALPTEIRVAPTGFEPVTFMDNIAASTVMIANSALYNTHCKQPSDCFGKLMLILHYLVNVLVGKS